MISWSLEIGDNAPDFSLLDQDGFLHRLQDDRGRFVLLFFYPKSRFSRSHQLAENLERYYRELFFRNVVIYGITNDSIEKSVDFKEKLSLSYDILSDSEGVAKRSYLGKKWFNQSHYMIYLIGPKGSILRKWVKKGSIHIFVQNVMKYFSSHAANSSCLEKLSCNENS